MEPRSRSIDSRQTSTEALAVKKAGNAGSASQKRKRHRILDVLVILLCIFFAALFIYLFWRNFYQSFVKANETSIGVVTYKKKAVQRRFLEKVLWDRLKNESPVYNGDLIRTSDISEATVTFANGQSVDLDENSLIQILADENGPRIAISDGGVSVNGGEQGITLSAGGRTISIAGGGAITLDASGGMLKMAVEAGSARLSAEDGLINEFTQGNGISIDADGNIITDPHVVVFSPKPQLKILATAANNAQVEFSWNTQNYTGDLFTRIEIASDRNFNNISISQNYETAKSGTLSIPVGTAYWRIYPLSRNGGVNWRTGAANGKLTVLKNEAPQLISPAQGETLSYRTSLPAVRLQWTANNDAASYRLVIANNAQLTNPEAVINAIGVSQTLSSLREGTWYWRVEPIFSGGLNGGTIYSNVGSFTINRGTGGLPPPNLVSPTENGYVSIARNGPDTNFSWKSDPEAASFQIMISRDASFSSPVVNRNVVNNYFTYSASKETALTPGPYYWAVTQRDAAGNVSPPSATRIFQAGAAVNSGDLSPLPPPVLVSPQNGSRAAVYEDALSFRWREVAGASSYRFRLYRSDNLTQPFYETMSNNAAPISVSVSSGAYTWTVQAFGRSSDGAFERAGTIANAAFTARQVNLAALRSPANGAQVAGLAALRGSVYAEWSLGEQVRYSRFVLSTSPNPLDGRALIDITNPSSPLKLPSLPRGVYYWTVSAETIDGYSASALSANVFTVGAAQVEPIRLISPPNGAEIALEDARRYGLVLWSSSETPARSRFVLSRNANPLSGTPLVDIQNPERSITLPQLEPGRYYWTVTGVTAENITMNAQTVYSFTINPEPPLPAVTYLAPRNGSILSPAELRENRRIDFSWQPVEGATEYVFVLRDTSGNIITNPWLVFTTHFTLDDISGMRDGGIYRWSVTAQRRGADGRIERAGTSSETYFVFDFTRPERLEANPPGVLYGR